MRLFSRALESSQGHKIMSPPEECEPLCSRASAPQPGKAWPQQRPRTAKKQSPHVTRAKTAPLVSLFTEPLITTLREIAAKYSLNSHVSGNHLPCRPRQSYMNISEALFWENNMGGVLCPSPSVSHHHRDMLVPNVTTEPAGGQNDSSLYLHDAVFPAQDTAPKNHGYLGKMKTWIRKDTCTHNIHNNMIYNSQNKEAT